MKRILLCISFVLVLAGVTGVVWAQEPSAPAQPAPTSEQATTPDQASATGQSSQPAADPAASTSESSNLPKTASPLPLVAAIGLASLAIGVALPRRRSSA